MRLGVILVFLTIGSSYQALAADPPAAAATPTTAATSSVQSPAVSPTNPGRLCRPDRASSHSGGRGGGVGEASAWERVYRVR